MDSSPSFLHVPGESPHQAAATSTSFHIPPVPNVLIKLSQSPAGKVAAASRGAVPPLSFFVHLHLHSINSLSPADRCPDGAGWDDGLSAFGPCSLQSHPSHLPSIINHFSFVLVLFARDVRGAGQKQNLPSWSLCSRWGCEHKVK